MSLDPACAKYLNEVRTKHPNAPAYLRLWMLGSLLTFPAVTVAALALAVVSVPVAVAQALCEIGMDSIRAYVKRIKWGVRALRHFATPPVSP